jgi:anti-sigma B factor antagonist
LPPAER